MTASLPAPPATPNAVHALVDRIASAFTAAERATGRHGDLEGLLDPALRVAGWNGTGRQAAEAKPYLAPIDTIAQLRATLHRLGVETSPVAAVELKPAHAPCLVASRDGRSVLLVLMIGETHASALAADRDDILQIPIERLEGPAWHIRHVSADPLSETPRSGWIHALFTGFSREIWSVVFLTSAINAIVLTVALYAMAIYDFAIPARAFDTVAMLTIGGLVAVAVEYKLRKARADRISWLVGRFDTLVATATYMKVLSLPLTLTEPAGLGTQLARFKQFRLGAGLFTSNVAGATLDLPFTLVSLGVLFMIGGSIAFVPVAVAAVLAILFLAAGPSIVHRSRQIAEFKNKADNLLVEIATKHDTIREAQMADALRERAGDLYRRYLEARFRTQQLDASLQATSQAVVGIGGLAVLALGALRVMDETLTTGGLVATMAIIWRVLTPIQTVCLSLFRLQQFAGTIGQIEQLMKLKPETPDRPRAIAPRRFQGHIRIKDGTLRYPGKLDFGLKSVNADFPAGSLVAVTGPSGSGKSTLLKSILGLYPVQAGRITVDGSDLRQIDLSQLRQATFYLPQDPVLFHGTICQNVRLAAPDATDAEVAAALAAFEITLPHPLLPLGLETRVGGFIRRQSSAGVMQRVALAAAFIRERPLILLDTPAQHLDSAGDRALMAALGRMKGRATVIFVTQRPSHMQICDRVIVMRDGEVAAHGAPHVLLPRLKAAADGTRAA